MVNTIEWGGESVRILDQTKLPLDVEYIECRHYSQVADCIKKLCIRGAPAIGIATAMGIALAGLEVKAKDSESFIAGLAPAMEMLLATRPTAVNIKWAVDRITGLLHNKKSSSVEELRDILVREAIAMLNEDIEINRSIGKWGAQFLKDGDTVLTHCNAGSLATGGYGTATAPIRVAIEQGKKIEVIADETRPVLQGARLTVWELQQSNIPVTLITDNSAGALMKKGLIDRAIVGTDRTVANGDVANKIGTYSVAVLCKEHGIPFYVAAPMSSIDFSIPSGDLIPIEERDATEVTRVFGSQVAPDGTRVINMAFDVTPAKYVTAIFTEKGPFRPEDLAKVPGMKDPESLRIHP